MKLDTRYCMADNCRELSDRCGFCRNHFSKLTDNLKNRLTVMCAVPEPSVVDKQKFYGLVSDAQVYLRSQCSNRYYIQGKTFHVKEELKKIGAQWDEDRKQWHVDKGKKAI